VEVDGGSLVGRGAADVRRDRKLGRLGYRVVRVESDLVLSQQQLAVDAVRRTLAQ